MFTSRPLQRAPADPQLHESYAEFLEAVHETKAVHCGVAESVRPHSRTTTFPFSTWARF